MWIKIKMGKTYSGPLGLFLKDITYPVPQAKADELKKAGAQFAICKAINKSPQDKQMRPDKAGKKYRTK